MKYIYNSKIHDASIIEILSEGKSIAHFCALHGLPRYVFNNWTKSHESFKESYLIALQKSLSFWIDLGHNNLNTHPFQANVWLQNMRNRFGWADHKKDVLREHKGFSTDPIAYAEKAYEDGKLTLTELEVVHKIYNTEMEGNKPITVNLNIPGYEEVK